MWLGSHVAMAVALIQPLAWEPPYAVGVALEKVKIQKNRKTNKQTKRIDVVSESLSTNNLDFIMANST